jgi:hypothetical protein
MVGCGTLSPSQRPEQNGAGNTQKVEQNTAGTLVHGAVTTFTQNTGLTPLGLAISIILGCWVIAAMVFGMVAKIEVQGIIANVACWAVVVIFGIVLPIVVYMIATGGHI